VEFFDSEISAFLLMAAASIALVVFYFKFSIFDATFHVLSAMSTTGFNYIPIQSFPDNLKLFFVFLMFVGGASFSTAGGIKIFRLVLLLKATKKSVVETVTEQDSQKIKLFGREYSNMEILQSAMLVLLAVAIVFVSSLIVSCYGYRPIDSVFETTAALATAGLSTGIVNFSLALELKWLFIFLMLMGRVEIFAFLVMFCGAKEHTPQKSSRSKGRKTSNGRSKAVPEPEKVAAESEPTEPTETVEPAPTEQLEVEESEPTSEE
jgi:trk system potassium uptake protein TrkH